MSVGKVLWRELPHRACDQRHAIAEGEQECCARAGRQSDTASLRHIARRHNNVRRSAQRTLCPACNCNDFDLPRSYVWQQSGDLLGFARLRQPVKDEIRADEIVDGLIDPNAPVEQAMQAQVALPEEEEEGDEDITSDEEGDEDEGEKDEKKEGKPDE